MPETHNQSSETKKRKTTRVIGMRGEGLPSIKQPITAQKKEIPMLFSTPMVKALKNGIKTETRRERNLAPVNESPNTWTISRPRFVNNCEGKGPGTWAAFFYHDKSGKAVVKHIKCPYGKIGDKIWVRETWCHHGRPNNKSGLKYAYKENQGPIVSKMHKWKPSIHMPKVAARIWLEITNIRCERLQDITNEASLAEGIETKDLDGTTTYRDYSTKIDMFAYGTHFLPKNSYKTLWKSINGKGSWEKNPWVWVIEFKKVSYKKPRGSYKRKI